MTQVPMAERSQQAERPHQRQYHTALAAAVVLTLVTFGLQAWHIVLTFEVGHLSLKTLAGGETLHSQLGREMHRLSCSTQMAAITSEGQWHERYFGAVTD